MKVKGTIRAWTTSRYHDIAHVEKLIKDKDFDSAVNAMSYVTSDMSRTGGWVEVGVATITVEFFPRDAIVSKQIDGLLEQLRQHRVNAELSERAILDRISNLTALTA